MIGNPFQTWSAELLHSIPRIVGQSPDAHSTVFVIDGYFSSTTESTAISKIDYLESPMEQIRDQINTWLSKSGSQTSIQTDDATLLVAPPRQISQDHIDSYESVFKTVTLYRAQVGDWNGEVGDVPSEDQKNAALLGLANLLSAFLPAPSPMFLEDGTVGAFWRRGQCYASIDFEIDGKHSWAGTDGTHFHSGTWNTPGSLPPMLINELLSIRQ